MLCDTINAKHRDSDTQTAEAILAKQENPPVLNAYEDLRERVSNIAIHIPRSLGM